MKEYSLNQIVTLKKAHPCTSKSNKFTIIGFDGEVRLKCLGCNGIILIKKASFYKSIKE